MSSHSRGRASASDWYPVIFPERCDGCRGLDVPKCIQFCSHDIYAIQEGKTIVVNPQNCVNGCTACRPICPKKAIEFPMDPGFMKRKDRAWSEGLLELRCKKCGRLFWSDSKKDSCWACSGRD